jgi:hypothetical protein
MHRQIAIFLAVALSAAAQPSLSNLAAGVLDQTKQARQAIAAQERDAALNHVRRAIATVAEIQQNAGESARPLLIPIYRQVETTTTVTPVKHNDAELKKNSSIRGVEGETTTARLDITAASNRLQTAQEAMQNGDWGAADGALAGVENSVSVSQSSGEMPLRMAQRNLELARTRIQNGRYGDAELPLKSAAQALGEYEKGFSGQQATDIEAARQAMLGYATSIHHDHGAAMDRIDSWLDMLRQWAPSPQ